MTSSRWQAHRNLETVVDKPLEGRKSAYHRNTRGQAAPETWKSDLAVNATHCSHRTLASWSMLALRPNFSVLSLTLPVSVQLADHDVCRM